MYPVASVPRKIHSLLCRLHKNKPHDGQSENAFVLGSMDCNEVVPDADECCETVPHDGKVFPILILFMMLMKMFLMLLKMFLVLTILFLMLVKLFLTLVKMLPMLVKMLMKKLLILVKIFPMLMKRFPMLVRLYLMILNCF